MLDSLFARGSCGFGRSTARLMAVHEAVHSAAMSTANFMCESLILPEYTRGEYVS